jgi:hypothetical protein
MLPRECGRSLLVFAILREWDFMSWSSWLREVFGIGSKRPLQQRSRKKRTSATRFFRLEAEGLEERLTPFSYRYYAQGGWTADSIAVALQTELNPNVAPTISNQSFSVNENVAIGATVGTVAASDPNAGQTLTYAITGGNTGNAFAINANTGVITTASAINFETLGTYTLTVRVTDNAGTPLSKTATVTINVNNVNEPPTVQNGAFSVNENSANGTVVGTVSAADPDAGSTLTYSIVSGNTGNAFAINPTTGQITVAGSLDFETLATYSLVVQATDNGNPALNGTATITINLNNVNETPSVTAATFNVNENANSGTVVGTVAASDPDANTTLTYSIVAGNIGNVFAINAQTGQITVVGQLDFETVASYGLTVQVADSGNPALTGQATITIHVNDVNDAPVIAPATFSVPESATSGTAVGTVAATNVDSNQTLTYSITAGNTGGVFAIDPATGAITVVGAVDFETTPTYTLTVQATDNGNPVLSGQATITINVSNVNESPSVTATTFTVAENASSGTVVGTVAASDPDANTTLAYAITAGNTGNVFAIDPATGQVTVVGTLDFETTPSYSLTVQATDNGTPALQGQATITITITNVNESPTVTPATFSVAENAANGAIVGTVSASDPDAGTTLTYSIVSGNTGNVFAINPSTGQITVAGALDFETTAQYTLVVQATDNGTPVLSGQATITVNVTDANDGPAVSPATFSVAENSANGVVVGSVSASDPDGGTNLTYAITAGNTGNVFAIDPATGQITVAGALDFETTPNYSLTVSVTDNGNPAATGQATITINLSNVNDAPTVSPAMFAVAENAATGTVVGTVQAADQDAGTTLTYAILGGNTGNAFAIDPATGEITVNGSLDFETLAAYSLTVQATDNGNPTLSNTATITINLTNVNEAPTATATTFAVNENVAAGTVVGTVSASDIDAGSVLTYAITAGNTGNVFAIDPATGQLTVAGSLNFETHASYLLTVQVTDNGNPALTGQATITIQANDLNETPSVSPATFTIDENAAIGAAVGTISASDPDAGAVLTYAITAGNIGNVFHIDPATGEITVVGALDFETLASYSLTVEATDNGNPALSGAATITIHLNDVNEADPVVSAATFSVDENVATGTVVGTVAATDADTAQTLTYAIIGGNTGNAFAIDPATGEITVVGSLNFETLASYTLTVQATDNVNPTRSGQNSITINVNNVNEAPIITPAMFGVAEDAANGTVVGTVSGSDPDAGSTLTYAITAGNTGNVFAIDPATGAITVVGSLDFETLSTYTLTVQVADNGSPGLTGSATITIHVTDVNEAAPVVAAATFAIDENSASGTVVGTASATDADTAQSITYSISAGNTGNAFAINASTGQITVNGPLNFETLASYSLTVVATDNGTPSLTGQNTITINVNNVNDAPVASDQTFNVADGAIAGTVVGAVAATDEDAGQTLAYAISAGNDGNAFALDPLTGQITVAGAIAASAQANYSLTIEIVDDGSPSLSKTITVSITVV